jgi:Leucine-rich repeat (LRR) protein
MSLRFRLTMEAKPAYKHLSRVAEGFESITEGLSCVDAKTELLSICFHGNAISHCAGLEGLTNLTELNLSANIITTLQGFQPMPELRTLNLASNCITTLDGIPALPKLSRLSVAHNRISSLLGLCSLERAQAPLEHLDLRNNAINELTELAVLAPLSSLHTLNVSGGSRGNGISQMPSLFAAVATAVPQVRSLWCHQRFCLTAERMQHISFRAVAVQSSV